VYLESVGVRQFDLLLKEKVFLQNILESLFTEKEVQILKEKYVFY